jgi:hypothetical protein
MSVKIFAKTKDSSFVRYDIPLSTLHMVSSRNGTSEDACQRATLATAWVNKREDWRRRGKSPF